MDLLSDLSEIWQGREEPFFVQGGEELRFRDLEAAAGDALLGKIQPGEVVALVGDFDPPSMALLLRLIQKRVILVPLTADTREQHEYFFQSAGVEWVLEKGELRRLAGPSPHPALQSLRERGHPGLVLFTTGTTGRPKAILHDFEPFLRRFRTPRPALRALSFLRFDHIGGLNTLLHVLYNRGLVVAPESRSVEGILEACRVHAVEVLPTTPTFLRMLLLSGLVPDAFPASLKVITYGTERMDEPTLMELCRLLPEVDFRQTYGMSELGILRVKSEARDSLFMRVGGEGVETRVEEGTLRIRAANRMMGYLNAESPFDEEGWYDTKDLVEEKDGLYKVVGRRDDVINVGGLKVLPAEIENYALQYPGVERGEIKGKPNPITGNHIEMTVQASFDTQSEQKAFQDYMGSILPAFMVPRRYNFKAISVGHRFKTR